MAIFWCQKLFEGSSTLRFGEQYIAVSSLISENIYRRVFICIWNNNIITLHMIAIMAKLPSGTFKIVQKECSFTRIGCIVAEIKSFMHLHLTFTSYYYRTGSRLEVWHSVVYIGAYGTFKCKWSYILRYVWIDNFHGYLLVSNVVWRKCYAAVWRTIYSSKFAYFGKNIDANLYAYETIWLQ